MAACRARCLASLIALSLGLACAGGPARQASPPVEIPGMVYIPAGPFQMGADDSFDDEQPAHQVELPGYYIDVYEVTVGEYRKFAAATGRTLPVELDNPVMGKDELPVMDVTYEDAAAYAAWAGKRLPTEAEWEKAARGTDGRRYPWGNEPVYHGGRQWACYSATLFANPIYTRTVPGDFYATDSSPFGVRNLAGNVAEWTADTYVPYPGNDRPNRLYGTGVHVIRGGGWDSSPDLLRTTRRQAIAIAGYHHNGVGFRCAKDAR
ncbi:MAG: formylglycine-generating enzyme family protein [Deltaproteobacteria bacterium]|nr:formylglycine-generating enzyme family protein [Deltaproteobacteria bacterium]NCP95053.1 formylglycine-generating enzyme family protein [Deltaproteobacteria bacterium]NCS74401.1 formylglycine-generating enzyme family protein [Deltaproteobacteria bacterium]OIP65874.1 MAG: hypothetical protein AUK30_03745 [Nitrospirae bacterium CG2_30_70_394]